MIAYKGFWNTLFYKLLSWSASPVRWAILINHSKHNLFRLGQSCKILDAGVQGSWCLPHEPWPKKSCSCYSTSTNVPKLWVVLKAFESAWVSSFLKLSGPPLMAKIVQYAWTGIQRRQQSFNRWCLMWTPCQSCTDHAWLDLACWCDPRWNIGGLVVELRQVLQDILMLSARSSICVHNVLGTSVNIIETISHKHKVTVRYLVSLPIFGLHMHE